MKKNSNPSVAPVAPSSPLISQPWVWFGFLVVFALVVFRDLIPSTQLLFTTDDNIGQLAERKAALPWSFAGAWTDSGFLGSPALSGFKFTDLLLWLMPVHFFKNWIHAIYLTLSSVFFVLFLRRRGLSGAAALLGALSAVWLGSTFFLIYAGHLGKFGVVLFATLFLWLVERAVATQRLSASLLAGGALGLMLMEQPDVGFFFALILGAYACYAVVRERGWQIVPALKLLAPIVMMGAALAFYTVGGARDDFSTGGQAEGDPQANWLYCTQWSWPPDETIEFIAPGYMGWRSGEPEGPYWGRLGRSAEWEATGQGFMNFKLETFYLGALPVVFALFALMIALRDRRLERSARLDVWFWALITLVTFLLALGKFFPLYRLFYLLPGMASIRNPVKFMQVFQLGFGFLAAWGLDRFCVYLREAPEALRRPVSRFISAVGGAALLFFLWAMMLDAGRAPTVAALSKAGWGNAASLIVENRFNGLLHAALLLLLGAAIMGLAHGWGRGRAGQTARLVALLCPLLVALDQLTVSAHYVKHVPAAGFTSSDTLVKFLKPTLGHQRVYLLSQDGPYNAMLSIVFPYHGINAFNVSQMPRMPADYQQWLGAMGRNLTGLWSGAAVGLVMGPASLNAAIQKDPVLAQALEPVFSYNLYPAPGGGFMASAATATTPGQQVIYRFKQAVPRFALMGGWDVVSDAEALARLARPDYRAGRRVLIAESTAGDLPRTFGTDGELGTVEVQAHRASYSKLRVSCPTRGIVRAADKYAGNWSVTVDGKPAELRRCDFLSQGVVLEAGLHEVEFTYRRVNAALYGQWLSLGLLALCGLVEGPVAALRRRRTEPSLSA